MIELVDPRNNYDDSPTTFVALKDIITIDKYYANTYYCITYSFSNGRTETHQYETQEKRDDALNKMLFLKKVELNATKTKSSD